MDLCFAPMEGITGYVFRRAYAACYGGIDSYYTPFLSNPVLNQIELHDVLPENNAGISLIPQILANRPESFAAIATTLKEYGYSEVNLNLGCPSGTVVAKNRGSGALREPRELTRLLDGIFSSSPLPVSVKCRIGISSEAEWEDILEVLLRFPITKLIIHPRLQKEFYKGEVHLDAFRLAYERVMSGSGPELYYNGDVRTVADYRRISDAFPGIAGIMIGRGLLSDPMLGERIRKTKLPDSSSLETSDPADEASENAVSTASDPETDPETFSDPIRKPGSEEIRRLQGFLDLLLSGYHEEMEREGPALMKLKELWSYLQVYLGLSPKEMRPLWKTKTLAEYRDVVNMLLCRRG